MMGRFFEGVYISNYFSLPLILVFKNIYLLEVLVGFFSTNDRFRDLFRITLK